jgi:hypothetical protein
MNPTIVSGKETLMFCGECIKWERGLPHPNWGKCTNKLSDCYNTAIRITGWCKELTGRCPCCGTEMYRDIATCKEDRQQVYERWVHYCPECGLECEIRPNTGESFKAVTNRRGTK